MSAATPQSASPAQIAPVIGAYIIGDELLSGHRQDQHLTWLIATLAKRGLALAWCQFIGDDRARLAQAFAASLARDEIVFSMGGIGATPDDHTRQAMALACQVPLQRHAEAVAEMEARFGAETYPNRVKMAEFPVGARIIPNPINRIAGFSIGHHHCVPGFPDMAWPMIDWVLDTAYPTLRYAQPRVMRCLCEHAKESALLTVMEKLVADFPTVKFSSLPRLGAVPAIEFGLIGEPHATQAAANWLQAQLQGQGLSPAEWV